MDPDSVLLVGNSYTARNDLADALGARLVPAWGEVTVRSLTEGGARWVDHLEHVRRGDAPWDSAFGDQASWDVVVFQEQSQTPALEVTSTGFLASVEALETLVDEVPAERVMLFQTWGRRDDVNPSQGEVTAGYATYASALADAGHDVVVARVGEAFGWVRSVQGEATHAELYAADGSHPSGLGTRLAAEVLAASLTGDAPVTTDPVWLGDAVRAVVEVSPDPPDELPDVPAGCGLVLEPGLWGVLMMVGLVRRRK